MLINLAHSPPLAASPCTLPSYAPKETVKFQGRLNATVPRRIDLR